MCGHKDVVTGSAIPGVRGLYTWVKNHAHYGKRATDGGVSESTTAMKYHEETEYILVFCRHVHQGQPLDKHAHPSLNR